MIAAMGGHPRPERRHSNQPFRELTHATTALSGRGLGEGHQQFSAKQP
jgi:hypothetical protein